MSGFRERAERARVVSERLGGRSAHEQAMAASFPLGAGFGRTGDAKRMDRSITRSVKATEAASKARYLEAQAEAFEAGRITAQGRARDAVSDARRDKAAVGREARATRIAAAKAIRGDLAAWQVTSDVYATAAGYLGGAGRQLVVAEHTDAVAQALADGLPVPSHVQCRRWIAEDTARLEAAFEARCGR